MVLHFLDKELTTRLSSTGLQRTQGPEQIFLLSLQWPVDWERLQGLAVLEGWRVGVVYVSRQSLLSWSYIKLDPKKQVFNQIDPLRCWISDFPLFLLNNMKK